MSRNSSGTYSLTAGQPVVTGTTISSSTFNTLASDLATEMTDSLSRSNKGGMLAPLSLTNGTVGLPSLTFINDTTTGLYRVGLADIGFAISGVKVHEWTATAETIVQPLTCSGTATVTGAFTASSTAAVIGDFAVATNKFTVTAASGNTLVAGTLTVTGTVASGAITATATAGNVPGIIGTGNGTANGIQAVGATNVNATSKGPLNIAAQSGISHWGPVAVVDGKNQSLIGELARISHHPCPWW